MSRAERLGLSSDIVVECAGVNAKVHSILSLIVPWEIACCNECLLVVPAVTLVISAKKTLVTSLLLNLLDRVSFEYLLTRDAFVS